MSNVRLGQIIIVTAYVLTAVTAPLWSGASWVLSAAALVVPAVAFAFYFDGEEVLRDGVEETKKEIAESREKVADIVEPNNDDTG